jgi:rhodanese-related sulfurtransferase
MTNDIRLRWLGTVLLLSVWLAPSAVVAGEAVAKISPAVAAQQVNAGKAILVDVRERNELDAGMAEGAHWFPTSKIKSDPEAYRQFIAELPQGQTLVFYCEAGGRAGKAADIASDQLGRKAANLGGFRDWKAAGLPVATPAKTLDPG